jgi:hypothetical protein
VYCVKSQETFRRKISPPFSVLGVNQERKHHEEGSKQNSDDFLFDLLFSTEDGREMFSRKAS